MLRISCVATAVALSLALANPAHAGLCAYAVANVEGEVMAHPVVIVLIDDGAIDVDPVIVHVDPTEQTVLGYSVATPGIDYSTDPVSVFLPGIDESVEGSVHGLLELETEALTCLSGSATTPAIPIYIPASELEIPGTQTTVPAIAVNWLGKQISYPGSVITTDSHTIYVPAIGTTIRPITVAIPDRSVAIQVGKSVQVAPVLEPLRVTEPDADL